MTDDDETLIAQARAVLNPWQLSSCVEAGGVGSALITDQNNIYVGVCIDAQCGIGFCAEHAAIASMVTAGESKIITIVAVDWDGAILPPCGRCREFIYQVNGNGKTRVILKDKVVSLDALLPTHWLDKNV